ncbi:MAG: hypothetical protein SFV32_10270 [Opitutaceae bacterium]|nr:hypothetical protein [Opitutaceae bacterium]
MRLLSCLLFLVVAVSSFLPAHARENPPAGKSPYPQILYWKWVDDIFVGDTVERKVDDLCARSDFDTICVSFHWMKADYFDPRLQDAIKRCVERLKKHGRSLILDIDIRTEGDDYVKEFPGERMGFAGFGTVELDDQGRGSLFVKEETVHRFGRTRAAAPDKLLGAWAFSPAGDYDYVPGSLADILGKCTVEKAEGGSRLVVDAGPAFAGRRAALFPHFTHVVPDLFSPNLPKFVERMFKAVETLPLRGTAVDEWGISMIFHFDSKGLYFKELAYSPFLDQAYASRYGKPLREDLLLTRVGPEADRIRVANQYITTLRAGMAANEKLHYDLSKRFFGADSFVGTHPTWTAEGLEVQQNGLNWWEVKRDFGQTDEGILIPIRLALGHKAGGAVWYNMYYSMDMVSLAGFFPETWTNARWGGRTHNLGYDCPNEQVNPFQEPGRLESIWQMESEITKLNHFQKTAPDSRVLILFGMEAATNWQFTPHKGREFRYDHPVYMQILKTAKGVFEAGWLCDLVPTSEVANGSVVWENGKLRYGSQRYDAVVLLAPDSLPRAVWDQLRNADWSQTPLLVAGQATWFDDGSKVTDEAKALFAKATQHVPHLDAAADIASFLKEHAIAGNRFTNGCVFQDGSLIFTADAKKPTGNPLTVDVTHLGHRIQFEGHDFLALRLTETGEVTEVIAGANSELKVNGKPVALGGKK